MATKDELRDLLDELDAEQPGEDASHKELTDAVRAAEAEGSGNGEGGYEIPDDHASRDANDDVCDYYCPGCGRGHKAPVECVGRTQASPHPPIQTVSTDELTGDPDSHTPAPDSVV